MKNKPSNYRGFTIVEVLVVILVVGILATLSVAGYKRYMAKVLVAQAIAAAAPLQQAIMDYYQDRGMVPGNNDLTAVPPGYSSGYIPTINNPITDVAKIAYWSDGGDCSTKAVGTDANCTDTGSSDRRQIEITFSNPTSVGSSYLSGKIFILRVNLTAAGISWVCRPYDSGSSTLWLDSSLLPNGCVG